MPPVSAVLAARLRQWEAGRMIVANQDMKSASATYAGFINLAKYGTLVSAAVAALVIVLIS